MGNSTIGIKIADGSYYPVLEHGFRGRKRLILTTVKDNQSKVQIDLYRGNDSSLSKAQYIGSLLIENIPPAAQGKPEIALIIGLDSNNQLTAEASDASTGESETFSTTLATLEEAQTYEAPEFSLDEDVREVSRKRGSSTLLLAVFIVLGVILLGCIGFFIYKAVQGPKIPTTVVVQPAQTQPAQTQPAQAEAAESQAKPAATQPAQSSATEAPAPAKKVYYKVKRGDTLWDISAAYYRNPWLYPRIAKANKIKNPDLIFVGARIVIPSD